MAMSAAALWCPPRWLMRRTFELRPSGFEFRQAEIDRGQDPFAVGLDRLGQLHEGRDLTALGPAEPPVEMLGRVGGPAEPVQVTNGLLQLPAAVKRRGTPTELVQHLELVLAEVGLVLEQRPGVCFHHVALGCSRPRNWFQTSRLV